MSHLLRSLVVAFVVSASVAAPAAASEPPLQQQPVPAGALEPKLVASLNKLLTRCILVYRWRSADRESWRDAIVAEPEWCDAAAEEATTRIVAAGSKVAAQYWWWLRGSIHGAVAPGEIAAAGLGDWQKRPPGCRKQLCATRHEAIADKLADGLSDGAVVSRAAFALQEIAAGRLAPSAPFSPTEMGPFEPAYAWLTTMLWERTGRVGCRQAPWDKSKATPCATWWVDWYRKHGAAPASWSTVAAKLRAEHLGSADLALRWAALSPAQDDAEAWRGRTYAAARPVWLDARTPRPIADAYYEALGLAADDWWTMVYPPNATGFDLSWAVVPQAAPAGPPPDPTATSPPQPVTLTAAQSAQVGPIAEWIAKSLDECEPDGLGWTVDERPAICAQYRANVQRVREPALAAVALVRAAAGQVADQVDGRNGFDHQAQTPGMLAALRKRAGDALLLQALAAELQRATTGREVARAAEVMRLLAHWTGAALCAIPNDTDAVPQCTQTWLDFCAGHARETAAQWRAWGTRQAQADIAHPDPYRLLAVAEWYVARGKKGDRPLVRWLVRNTVLLPTTPPAVRARLAEIRFGVAGLDVLYPKDCKQALPNLALPRP